MEKIHKKTFLFQCQVAFNFNDSQIKRIEEIIDYWNENSNMTVEQLASYLAQVKVESANTFGVIREFGPRKYFKYLIGKLGIRNLYEAYRHRGWGSMQTTGRYNFRMIERVLEEKGIVINLEQFINDKNRDKQYERKLDLITTFYCFENTFVTGQALTVTGCGSPFDGSRTVLESGYGASFDGLPSILDTRYNNYQIPFFTAAITNADISERKIIPVGRAVLTSQATLYDSGYPEISEACLAIACDIWITRTGTLGQQGVDFQSPAPYRLGRSMLTRVSGLLGKHLDTRGFIG